MLSNKPILKMMMMIYWALIYIYEYLFFEFNLNYNYNILHFLIIVCRNKFNDSSVYKYNNNYQYTHC